MKVMVSSGVQFFDRFNALESTKEQFLEPDLDQVYLFVR